VVRKSAAGDFKLHPTAAQRTRKDLRHEEGWCLRYVWPESPHGVYATGDSPFGLVAPKDEESDEGSLFLLNTMILPRTSDGMALMIRGALCYGRDGGQ
jgi:hypothetical protein